MVRGDPSNPCLILALWELLKFNGTYLNSAPGIPWSGTDLEWQCQLLDTYTIDSFHYSHLAIPRDKSLP